MPQPYPDPTRPTKTFIFDLETTGLLQRFNTGVRGDVGISELALRQVGKAGGFRRFTNILHDPLSRYDAGQIDARTFGEMLAAGGPTGARWQRGFKNPENVLYGVLERHVDATRGAIAGRGDILAKESSLVSLMSRYLRQGHKIQGWNVDFDLLVMSSVAAKSSPAVQQRWSKALNIARSRGQIEDLSTGAKKFMFLAAQESAMQGKSTGREFFTLGQVDKRLVNLTKAGKLSVEEIDKLTYDKLMEPHKGFKEFFDRRLGRRGRPDISFGRYEAWLRKKHSYLSRADIFATGQKYPNIRMVKGWSADILLEALAPSGIKGSTLEKRAIELSGIRGLGSHEALSDTVYEEILDDIFRVKSRTWAGAWDEIAPRLAPYGIRSQEEFFHRYRSAIESKGKTQLKEHAQEATRQVNNRWEQVLANRVASSKAASVPIARAAGSQPETLRRIYSQAGQELSGKWRMFKTAHPTVALVAQALAAASIVDYLLPDKNRPTKGVRDPESAPYANIDGITFGAVGRGSAKALTDFGSGRSMFNPRTRGFAEIAAYRSSLWARYPDMYGIDFKTLEHNYNTWTTALGSGHRDLLTRTDYTTVKAARVKAQGLNQDAWVGMIDLKSYKVKVDDADTLTIQRKGVVGMFRKPVSIRLAGIDAPEVEHGGIAGRIVQDQFGGRQASEYLEQLIERQQSLRLVVDPRSRSYNRHMGVLIGDRGANLNLQMVRSGAAAALPWNKRSLVDANVFAEAEAMAAAGGTGIWASKGWQMHRAMGLIAGERVTNTTLTQVDRIARSNALMSWYGLVQNAHDSDDTGWTPQEMLRMYQTGTAYRAQAMAGTNRQMADVGPLPGLRKPVNPWQIAGHGINPSDLEYANVSDFGSGRSVYNGAQLNRLPQGDNPIAEALRNVGMSMGEFQFLRAHKWDKTIEHKFFTEARFLSQEPLKLAETKKLLELNRLSGKFPDLAVPNFVPRDLQASTMAYVAERQAAVQRVIRHPEHQMPKRKLLAMAPMSEPVSQPASVTSTIQAVRDATKDSIEVPPRSVPPVVKAISRRSKQVLEFGKSGYGKALGVGAVAAAGLAVGGWLLLRNKDENTAATVAGGRMGPGEFVAMKSHPPFYSSSKAVQWAEHEVMGDPTMAAGVTRKEKALALGQLAAMVMPTNIADSPALKAWNYFRSAQGVGEFSGVWGGKVSSAAAGALVTKAQAGLHKALKDQGFSAAEVERWMHETKSSKGFVAKLTKDPTSKGSVEWLWEKWEGVKKWPARFMDTFTQKRSQLTKGHAQKINNWFKSLETRMGALSYGVSAEQYTTLVEAGRLNELRKTTMMHSWKRTKDNFKYLWKHMYKDARTFGAKADGARQIFTNVGQLEEMRMSMQANLLGMAPLSISRSKNIFTKTGQRLNVYMNRSKFFTGKFPKAAAKLTKMAAKLKSFGVSTAGKALGKVPIAGVAFGILGGIEMMDQYENSAKGFMVEAAASTVENTVGFAIMSQVAAGAKIGFSIGFGIGEVFPAGGGIVGGVLGAIIGVVGVLAAGLLAGHVAGSAVRHSGRALLGARMKRTVDPAAYLGPETIYPDAGFPVMRQDSPRSFQQLHAIDPSRPDLVPFGGAYNPIRAQDIDTRTLQIANNKRRVTADRQAPRPISAFTPTFGLVNLVLWNRRRGSRIRSVVERGASQHRLPRRDRNASRMLAHAA
jgi:endonuclease YncB( thermonuclease family)